MTHNQVAPGSSPGGTTSEIKGLQRCSPFFISYCNTFVTQTAN